MFGNFLLIKFHSKIPSFYENNTVTNSKISPESSHRIPVSHLPLCFFNAIDTVLPTGRLFGRLSQKEQNKKWIGRINLRPKSGQFCTEKGGKGAEKGQISRKCILTSLLTLILGKSKKYYTFATDLDKDNFCV